MTIPSSPMFNRRQMLKAAALTPLAGLALSGCSTKSSTTAAANKTVTVTSYGGSYNDQLTDTILNPFAKQTGIQPTLLANTSLAALKAQVQSGDVQWDLVEITAPEYETAVAEGLLEKFDYDIISDKGLPGYAKAEYGIKYLSFLFVMAWDETTIPNGQAPADWAQFFDQNRYSTKRSVYNQLSDSSILEAALLADGVPFDKIYPLDVDRALRVLGQHPGRDRLLYHSANQEPIQQLTSGEVSLSTSFNNRINAARADGAKLNFSPQNAVLAGDYFVVPKGAKNKEAAFKLMNFMSNDAEAGAAFDKVTNLTLANTPALTKLPQEIADTLPTSPKLADKILVRDDKWWATNLKQTEQQFKLWQAG
ncbi:extracellular solute-binding protein [Arthrobacter sp. 35W]|uniref:extracellular solute-binding protein n=1 Tax=Arthrobacter sp. 35W TaxID=1132441 RepID=UPI00041B99FE|nr:extracellular solute-binding protein [Arthrobacter sp. 35W]